MTLFEVAHFADVQPVTTLATPKCTQEIARGCMGAGESSLTVKLGSVFPKPCM